MTENKLPKPFNYAVFETLFGWVGVAGTEKGLIRIVLPEKTKKEAWQQLTNFFHTPVLLKENTVCFSMLIEKIKKYFAGEYVSFVDEKICLENYTSFQRGILQKAREIPYASVKTYKWLAEEANYPKAYRAAGGVMGKNPLPLIVPCHRVIGSGGRLVGFSATGGLSLKQRMLELEGILVK